MSNTLDNAREFEDDDDDEGWLKPLSYRGDNGIVFGSDDADEERAIARLLLVSPRWATRTQMLAALRASRCAGVKLSLYMRSVLVLNCNDDAAIVGLVVAGFEKVEFTPSAYELTRERAESIDTDESKSARRSFVARVHGDEKAESEMREYDTAMKWCAIRLAETQYRRTHATVETVDGHRRVLKRETLRLTIESEES